MSDDLLAKEKEFRRLNHELQQKTHDMIEEVDSVIHAPDGLFNNASQSYLNFLTKDVKTVHSKDNTLKTDKQSRPLDGIVEIPSENINNCNKCQCILQTSLKKDNSVENNAVVTLLKGKIDMLYKELQAIQLKYNEMCDRSKELEIENKKLDNIKIKLYNQRRTLNDTITKLENRNSDTISNHQALSNENAALKKNLENLKKELNMLSQESTNYNVRLNRSLESNEKLRNELKCRQIEEKELRNTIRKLEESQKEVVKHLERQRNYLVHALERQMLLVDNLKKQNIYLISNEEIRLTEEDFAKLLLWKPEQL